MVDKSKTPQRINAELIYYQLTSINTRLDKFEQVFVTKAESQALKHEIEGLRQDLVDYKVENNQHIDELRAKKQVKDTILWIGLTASAIINIIALYNVFNNGGK